MKQIISYMLTLAAATALIISCAKEVDDPAGDVPAGDGFVFTATTGAIAKTTVENGDGDERIVKWAAGDEISVYWDGGSTTATAGAAGTSTTFTPASTPSADMYYAAYPSGVATGFADEALTVVVPSSQTGTFAAANIAVAKTDDLTRDFQFANLTALVKFSVSGTTYTKAVFRGAKGETLAGTVPVDMSGAPTLGEVTSPAKEIEVALSGAGEYYISVLPCTLEGGFSISLYEDENTAPAAYLPKEVELARGTISNLGAVDTRSITNYFVKPDGSGKGQSWEKALNAEGLKALLLRQPEVLDGVTIHMAAGEYFLAGENGGFVEMSYPDYSKPVSVSFKGGYPANLTGTDISATRDTSVTAFTGTSGDVKGMVFMLKDQTNISFDGITFKNSVTSDSEHAAIGINSSTAIVTVSRCTFNDNSNSNTGQTGAALTLQDGTLTVINCTFRNNSARNAGALYLKQGTNPVRISYCKFDDNTSSNTSGAAQNAKLTDVKFAHCIFINNTAGSYGGGAFHTSTGAVTLFEDCVFSGNKASATGTSTGNGGAISIEQSGNVTCTRCVFRDNTANCGDKTLKGEANSAVKNNVAGGAIILRHAASEVILNDCSFSGNTAPNGCGGAIGSWVEGSSIIVNEGTSFIDNSSYFQGGAIFALGNLTVAGTASDRVQFSGNKTLHATRNYAQGGAIWVGSNTTSSIQYTLFIGNEAGVEATDGYSSGGAIRASAAAKVTVDHCEFTDNRGSNGNCFSYSNCTQECIFTDNNFHDNIGMSGANKDGDNSRFYGGVGEMTGGAASFERCSFKDNLARSHSGVLHFNGTPTVHFTDCLFDGNKCLCQATNGANTIANNGGGCFKCTDGMKMTLNRCIFKNNTSNNRGAVFQLGANDVLFMNQVAFVNNQLTATSGNIWGVVIHSGKSVICMNNVTSFNNSAASGAGTHYALNTDGGWIIANSTFVDNCTTGVCRANNTSNNGTRKSVFCNSIFINRKTANNVFALSTALTSAGHNVLSSANAPNNLTLDSSDVRSVTSLSGGSWSESGYLGYYSWTNNLSGFTAATETVVTDAIKSDDEEVGSVSSNIGSDFYNWLDGLSPKGYTVDARNEARTGTWWPGAYQQN